MTTVGRSGGGQRGAGARKVFFEMTECGLWVQHVCFLTNGGSRVIKLSITVIGMARPFLG